MIEDSQEGKRKIILREKGTGEPITPLILARTLVRWQALEGIIMFWFGIIQYNKQCRLAQGIS